MKKLLLTLAAVAVGFSTMTATTTVTGTQVTNETVATAIADGAVIALQCLDTNGGPGYYFNGAAVKTQTLSYANLFEVKMQDDGKFVLKKLATEEYVGCANTSFTGDALVAMTSDITAAGKFTASIATAGGWTTIWAGVVNGTNTIRFTAQSGAFLNTNNTPNVPKYFTGPGGFSVWYVYTYSADEVAALLGSFVSDYFETNTSEIRAVAQGFAAMSAVVGADCPNPVLPEDATPATVESAVADAVAQYNAYIAGFNNKLVTLYNNRRASGQTGYTGNNPWLAVYVNSNGNVVTNSRVEKDDDCVWQMKVESNKVRFYNRTTGYQLKTELLIPSQAEGGVKLQVDGGNNYIHLSGMTGDLMVWSDANDPGSVWTVALAEYTFCQPETSTAEAPKYYRIVSDRLISKGTNPMMGVKGENREEVGAGEQLSKYVLGNFGIYWRFEPVEGQDGACKIVNMIDGYEIGSTTDAGNAAKKNLTMAERGAGHEFYLVNLENMALPNGNNFTIANSYAISSDGTAGSGKCVDVNGDGLARYNEWTPVSSENKNNLGDNGSIWYFVPATDNEIEAAKTNYVAAVKSRMGIAEHIDDTDNLAALSNTVAVQNYTKLIAEAKKHMTLTTIDEINAFKRGGQESYLVLINAELAKIIDEYIVGQHVQFSATKPGWNTYYMKDATVGSATQIKPADSAEEYETLWVVVKVDGGYKLKNEATGRMIAFGQDSDSSVWPTTETEADAQTFEFNYNPAYGKFSIRKAGTTENDRKCIHMAWNNTNDGCLMKWSASGIENSYWYIAALAEPEVDVVSNGQGGYCVRLRGDFIENVSDDNDVLVRIYSLPEASTEEGDESEEGAENVRRKLRAAPAEAITHAEYTVGDFKTSEDKTLTVDDEFEVGKTYFMEVPGAKLITSEGKHTRNLFTSFRIESDGAVTGVEEVSEAVNEAVKVYYDLQGRRVANPRHGIFICNGKKVQL